MFDLDHVLGTIGAAAGIAAICALLLPNDNKGKGVTLLLFTLLSMAFLGADYWGNFLAHQNHIAGIQRKIGGLLAGNLMTREQLHEYFYRLDENDLDEALEMLSADGAISSKIEDGSLDITPRPPIKVTIFTIQ